MSKKGKDFFWLSYSDLMTSLFFVMLVLFVLVFSVMQAEQKRIQILLSEYEKIEQIKAAINSLNPQYFKYDPINKRHELMVDVLFTSGEFDIPEKSKTDLYQAGLELQKIITKIPETKEEVKFMVIIEGMAARYLPPEHWKNEVPRNINSTYLLSYNRAKALFQFWESQGIDFNEKTFEVILAGSGWYGAGRYSGPAEGKNKRFLIQILPKVGEIKKLKDDKSV